MFLVLRHLVRWPSADMVNLRCRKRSVAEFMQESIVFLVRVQCRRKEMLADSCQHKSVTCVQKTSLHERCIKTVNEFSLVLTHSVCC